MTTPLDADHRASDDAIRRAVDADLPRTIARLADLVRIPSVSWDAFDRAHVRASAEAVAELARATGVFERVEVLDAVDDEGRQGQPAVVAVRSAPAGAPRVLLYAHHDVQPPGSDADWDTPPYEPTVVGDRLHGRGASDDKAGVMTHVAAVEAVRAALGDDFPLGIALFVEGEEENGSRSFRPFLEAHGAHLDADVIVVADSDNPSVDVPGLTVSLRGNVTCTVTVRTLAHASHSGMFGGAAPDAMLATIRLLDTLWDEDGAVAVAGLTSRPGGAGGDLEDLRRDAGLLDGVRPIGRGELNDRLWNEPAITITGIDAPSLANASNTLVPVVSVRLSARIAPGQRAEDAAEHIRRHLEEHAPFGASVEISGVDAGNPFLVDVDAPAVTAMRDAMHEGWGTEAALTGIGGSIPFIADLVERFPDAQILVTGVEDPATRAHSPNESQHLGVLRRAILTEAVFLARLAAGGGNVSTSREGYPGDGGAPAEGPHPDTAEEQA
ncbi:dipeptidase [Pseudoclavibacter chungangensis]|uniref:Dipeptidase n=1 Tax=Pseudoclavibacter chungangensis TaxID=587635 RepID=A0A7J5C261_9MICO|nr:dipeptidase [Pseudoclavibacter chungangensis]KAB1660121.1 dipeptidase [Pseudoclavibacter chungangensis]NYJ66772.1 acetylornithine deacetylase/succinyl-diaminopimelate desuccinylase-like protein [Pseudoclavibacter chungangensis]